MTQDPLSASLRGFLYSKRTIYHGTLFSVSKSSLLRGWMAEGIGRSVKKPMYLTEIPRRMRIT